MKCLMESVFVRSGRRAWLLAAVCVALSVSSGCSTPAEAPDKTGEREIIGKPPPAEEDPFFVESTPAEAVPVAASGRIDEEESEAERPEAAGDADAADEQAAEAQEPAEQQEPDVEEPAEPAAQERQLASAAPQPEEAAPEAAPPAAPDQPQCFSCVRICPAEGDCDQAKDDVICGWGVHEDAEQAKRMARAECDATLDMARQMPVWSEIAGQCPAATCR